MSRRLRQQVEHFGQQDAQTVGGRGEFSSIRLFGKLGIAPTRGEGGVGQYWGDKPPMG
jgi:hypothetical protein